MGFRENLMTARLFQPLLPMSLALLAAAGAPIPQTAPAHMPVLAWQIQKSGTEASLRGVSVVDENTAWASGSQGTVLRTVDGGKNWRAVSVPGLGRTDLRDVEAFDADTAVVLGIGRPAKIFRTSDGGAHWAEVYSSDAPGIFLDALSFSDKNTGWAVGDPIDGRFVLLRTGDGGRTWLELPPGRRPAALEGEGCFAASGTCLVARGPSEALLCTGGPAARLLRTHDGGAEWTATPLPLLAGRPSFRAFGIAFRDDGVGLAVGGDYLAESAAKGNAAISSDGGASWALLEIRPPSGFRECAAFIPKSNPALALTAGPSGSDYSLDGGRTWAPIPGPAGWHSLGVSPDGRCAWAVGKGGLVGRIQIR
jgi:photosystem II stability/assembly factor-like uncharacterized protein